MDPQLFDDLQKTLESTGPEAAIERLCTALRERRDYTSLFYAMLMKKRHELGVSPLPTGPSQELPQALHPAYEEAIREAGRTVGQLFLEENNIPHAWAFYRMLNEPGPVIQALEKIQLKEDEDVQPIIEIALHQGVHPRKGFDMLLERYGICSAITTLSGMEFPTGSDARLYCIQQLIRALHTELMDRLRGEIERVQNIPSPSPLPPGERVG